MYRIEITKIDKDVPFRDREWKVVGKGDDGENKHEYIYFDNIRDVETQVYKQVVDDLHLVEVINAVNKEDHGTI